MTKTQTIDLAQKARAGRASGETRRAASELRKANEAAGLLINGGVDRLTSANARALREALDRTA